MNTIKPQTPKGLKKIAIFIDAANIFYSQKTLGWKVDYEKFLSYWGKTGEITGAYFYTAVISTNQKQLKFFKALEKIGYTVITCEVKIIKDNKKTIQKGNFDVKLAIDIVLKEKEYDLARLERADTKPAAFMRSGLETSGNSRLPLKDFFLYIFVGTWLSIRMDNLLPP